MLPSMPATAPETESPRLLWPVPALASHTRLIHSLAMADLQLQRFDYLVQTDNYYLIYPIPGRVIHYMITWSRSPGPSCWC